MCQAGSMKQKDKRYFSDFSWQKTMETDKCNNSPVSYLKLLLLCWMIICNQNSVYRQTHLSVSKLCLSSICFEDLIPFSFSLTILSPCLHSLAFSSCCAIRDQWWLTCVSASSMGCVPSRAIMSFTAQDFPWNNTVVWQIVGEDDWMFPFLAATLLLSADWSEVMWSATCLQIGAGSNISRWSCAAAPCVQEQGTRIFSFFHGAALWLLSVV